jgi:hypothetical protein
MVMKMEIARGGEREFRDLVIAEAAVASYKVQSFHTNSK